MIEPTLAGDVAGLVTRAIDLSSQLDADVEEIVRRAAEEPLSDTEARRLFERILTVLVAHRDGDVPPSEVGERVRAEVDLVMAGRAARLLEASGSAVRSHVELFSWNGLDVRPVVPTPIFNSKPVEMREGYVRTEDLLLWPENHRIELDVASFRERNGRAPGRDELIQILQGRMPLLTSEKPDPYKIRALADSIAVKGVQVPPVIDWWGVPKDGNRRLAACMLILIDPDFTAEQKERAARIRVWQTAENPSQDQIDAIVVSLNFEDDHKLPWPEYVKARQVARYWDELKLRFRDVPSAQDLRDLRREVAERFAIKTGEVTRYMKMVGWAERFQQHQVESRNRSDAEASFRANELFQYFYELDAGRGDDKLSVKMQEDDDFQALVFDLLYDGKFRNWTQVRHLRKVLSSEPALELVKKAHVTADAEEGRRLIEAALDEARKDDLAMKRIGMGDWLAEIVKRLDGAPPALWHEVDTPLLRSLRRVMIGAEAAVRAELIDRGEPSTYGSLGAR